MSLCQLSPGYSAQLISPARFQVWLPHLDLLLNSAALGSSYAQCTKQRKRNCLHNLCKITSTSALDVPLVASAVDSVNKDSKKYCGMMRYFVRSDDRWNAAGLTVYRMLVLKCALLSVTFTSRKNSASEALCKPWQGLGSSVIDEAVLNSSRASVRASELFYWCESRFSAVTGRGANALECALPAIVTEENKTQYSRGHHC